MLGSNALLSSWEGKPSSVGSAGLSRPLDYLQGTVGYGALLTDGENNVGTLSSTQLLPCSVVGRDALYQWPLGSPHRRFWHSEDYLATDKALQSLAQGHRCEWAEHAVSSKEKERATHQEVKNIITNCCCLLSVSLLLISNRQYFATKSSHITPSNSQKGGSKEPPWN